MRKYISEVLKSLTSITLGVLVTVFIYSNIYSEKKNLDYGNDILKHIEVIHKIKSGDTLEAISLLNNDIDERFFHLKLALIDRENLFYEEVISKFRQNRNEYPRKHKDLNLEKMIIFILKEYDSDLK